MAVKKTLRKNRADLNTAKVSSGTQMEDTSPLPGLNQQCCPAEGQLAINETVFTIRDSIYHM